MTHERLQHFVQAVCEHIEEGKPLDDDERKLLETLGDRTLHLGRMLQALERCYHLTKGLRLAKLSHEQVFEVTSLRRVLRRILTIHGVSVDKPKREGKRG